MNVYMKIIIIIIIIIIIKKKRKTKWISKSQNNFFEKFVTSNKQDITKNIDESFDG